MYKEVRIELQKDHGVTLEIAGKLWGDPNGDPWLFLHGWLDNAATFDLLAPKLLENLPGAQLLCIDMAGHGQSFHRVENAYHFIDYVADAFLVVQAMNWNEFSVVGHSLGQSVAAVLAGSFPSKVKRLVLIEGLGPSTDNALDIPRNLEKSLLTISRPPKAKKCYNSRQEAANRRVEGNAVGTLPYEAASILVSRGTHPLGSEENIEKMEKIILHQSEISTVYEIPISDRIPDEHLETVRWSFDEGVKNASRIRLTEPIIQAFFQRISCPTLLILAKDGLLARRGAKPTLITTFWGRLFVKSVNIFFKFCWYIPFFGRRFDKMVNITTMGANLCRRYTAIKNMKSVIIPSGGHHPQLFNNESQMIANEILNWTSK